MTREEAIKALTKERKTALHENKQAFDMAIKALKEIPDLKEVYQKGYKDGQEMVEFHLELCKEEQASILEEIKAIIQEDVLKYKMICEVLKNEEYN